ncbi:MAG: DUF1570 domain-containing protein [Planctomycetota bacterium]|jgi:hypothetical protein
MDHRHRRPWPSRILAALLPLAVAVVAAAADGEDGREQARATFEARLSTLRVGDREGGLSLGEWAIEQGLLDEADALYRAMLRHEPRDETVWRSLWHLSGSRPLRTGSEMYDATRKALDPERFSQVETQRYVVLSDADPKWTRDQAERLERAYDRFIRFANQLDLRPLPLRHKLVAVAFESFEDFARLAADDGNRAVRRIAGYYSPRNDRLVFYHVESNENIAKARAELEQQFAEIEAVREAARRMSSVGRREEARQMQEDLDRRLDRQLDRESRINDFARRQSISVTIHEAIHQLMFHTRVQSPRVHHPLWLSEGLATAFETEVPGLPFGPSREHWPRRSAFIQALERGRLLPLRELVVARSSAVADRPHDVGVMYAQSYALATWMARSKKLELREYLTRLNEVPAKPRTPGEQLAVFEAAFGDVERLERMWLRVERNDWLD